MFSLTNFIDMVRCKYNICHVTNINLFLLTVLVRFLATCDQL